MSRGGLLHLRGRLREEVEVPEVEIVAREPWMCFRALVEHDDVLAVLSNDVCIGWISVETLGYNSVRHWLGVEREEDTE